MTSRVLVVGGGIAGFGVARALALRGIACTVAERLPASSPSGQGINLPANAVRALGVLGVSDEVVRSGVPIRRREYRRQSGALLFEVDEEGFWGDVGPSVCLRRAVLADILRTDTSSPAAGAPVNVRWGRAVVRADPGEATVRVQMESGVVEEYGYVIGADGIHSAVRPGVQRHVRVRPSVMTAAAWRFVVPNPGVDCWTAWSGRRGTLLLIPVDERCVYGYASATRGDSDVDQPRWLESTFAGFPGQVRTAVTSALADRSNLYFSEVEEVYAERWTRNRIALIGDAAHAMGPVWAQGAALALEDGLVLAELLAGRSDWGGVGAEFEQTRRPRVAHVQAATDKMSRIASLPTWVRDGVGPMLGPRAYRDAYGPLLTSVLGDRAGD